VTFHTPLNPPAKADISVSNSDFGESMFDPASTPNTLSVRCSGNGCQNEYTLNPASGVFYEFMGQGAFSPLVLYGSRYVPSPLSILGPSNFSSSVKH